MNERSPMTEEQLTAAVEDYVTSFVLVEYGRDGLEAARDAYNDMELAKENITFIGFLLQTEEELQELVVNEFVVHA